MKRRMKLEDESVTFDVELCWVMRINNNLHQMSHYIIYLDSGFLKRQLLKNSK